MALVKDCRAPGPASAERPAYSLRHWHEGAGAVRWQPLRQCAALAPSLATIRTLPARDPAEARAPSRRPLPRIGQQPLSIASRASSVYNPGQKFGFSSLGDTMVATTVQIRRKGAITIPAELRRRYGISEGDAFTLVEMGGGTFLLTSQVSRVAHLGDRVARLLDEEGVTLEQMLDALDEERETYYREHYVQD